MASQSFTAPDGRRVLFGWVTAPHGADFAGGQTIPRIITASPGGALRFLPLPELTSLHLNRKSFGATATGSLARNTSNSYHLNATFHLTALAKLVEPTACAQAYASHRPHGSCGRLLRIML